MNTKRLKSLLADWEKRLAKEQTPESLRETLVSEFGKNLPVKIIELFAKYQSAYKNLADQYQKLRELITEAETNNLTEIPDEEMPNFDEDELLTDQYNLYTISSNLRIERNLIYRQKHAPTETILKTPAAEEKIVLTTPDFSDAFLTQFTDPLNQLCAIFSGAFNEDSVNNHLTSRGFYALKDSHINEGFYKDHARQICALDGQSANYDFNTEKGKQRTITTLTEFIDPCLTSLEKKFQKPNKVFNKDTMRSGLAGLISTLGAQSTLLNLLLKLPINSISFIHNNFVNKQGNPYTDTEHFSFSAIHGQGIELTQSRISFNQKTNKLEIEVFLSRRFNSEVQQSQENNFY